MDRVSAWGYAMGYIGGSTIPFVLAIIILFVMGMENPVAFKLVILLTSVWWLVFSIPFLKNVHQVHYVEAKKGLVQSTFRNLWATAKDIFTHKGVFLFMVAYFFYIDGVNTIISVSTSYGTKLGLDTVSMILALLVTQIVAMPFSILFGRLAGKVGAIQLLRGAVGVYFVITVVGFFMGFNIEQNPDSESALALSQVLFWCMAFLVGTVQGGIQALSRSYFGKLIPAERSNEYFGFFDIFGKFAAVLGAPAGGAVHPVHRAGLHRRHQLGHPVPGGRGDPAGGKENAGFYERVNSCRKPCLKGPLFRAALFFALVRPGQGGGVSD